MVNSPKISAQSCEPPPDSRGTPSSKVAIKIRMEISVFRFSQKYYFKRKNISIFGDQEILKDEYVTKSKNDKRLNERKSNAKCQRTSRKKDKN